MPEPQENASDKSPPALVNYNYRNFQTPLYFSHPVEPLAKILRQIKVLCEQTRELTHDFLDYV